MKQLCSETLKTLINELKADQPTRQYISEKLLRKKLLQSTNIDKVKRNLSYTIKLRCYNLGHNILRLFDVLRNFLSPQVKQIVIISNKHGIYWLPNELPNDLRVRILGNQEILSRSQIFIELQLSALSSSQNENFVNTSKTLFKN